MTNAHQLVIAAHSDFFSLYGDAPMRIYSERRGARTDEERARFALSARWAKGSTIPSPLSFCPRGRIWGDLGVVPAMAATTLCAARGNSPIALPGRFQWELHA